MRVSGQTLAVLSVLLAVGIAPSTVSAGKFYWSDLADGNLLKRAELDGSNVETVVPVGTKGVALDLAAGKVYWGQYWIDDALFTLRRADLDGSNEEALYESLLFLPGPLALDTVGGWLFTASFVGEGCDGIWRFPADGVGPGQKILNVCTDGLAVDGTAGSG